MLVPDKSTAQMVAAHLLLHDKLSVVRSPAGKVLGGERGSILLAPSSGNHAHVHRSVCFPTKSCSQVKLCMFAHDLP